MSKGGNVTLILGNRLNLEDEIKKISKKEVWWTHAWDKSFRVWKLGDQILSSVTIMSEITPDFHILIKIIRTVEKSEHRFINIISL